MPEKSIQKAHTADVVPTAGQRNTSQLGTIFGIEAGDIRLPYFILVRANTKNAKLKDGSRPKLGSLFHSLTKEAFESIDVLVCHATKGLSPQKKLDEDGDEIKDSEGNAITDMVTCYRALMVRVDEPTKPFVITFKGFNLYNSWREFISLIAGTGRTNLDVVVRIKSKDLETKRGYTNVFDLEVVGETTEEQKNIIMQYSQRLGAVTSRMEAEAEEEEIITETTTVQPEADLSFLHDNNDDLDSALGENTPLEEILKDKKGK